jgi:glycine hydroxymethyltransferase
MYESHMIRALDSFQAEDFVRVADIVNRAVTITQRLDKHAKEDAEAKGRKSPGSVKAFIKYLGEGVMRVRLCS